MSEMQLTEAELARLEELAGEATPGPWHESVTGEGVKSVNASAPDDYHGFSVCAQGMIINPSNISYIAAACNAAPALVAEVRRLRAEEKARGANTLLTAEDRATLRDIVACSSSWEPEARLLGNVRAIDIYTTIIRLSAVLDTASDNAEQAEAENAALRERVEALEWFVECMDNYEWNCSRSGWFLAHGVHHEAKVILDAARETIS